MLLSRADVLDLYVDKSNSDVIFDWKIAKNDERISSILIDFITKTQVGIKINLKVSTSSNVPVLYNRVFDLISDILSEYKLTLKELRFSIISAA
jgi:hypothetical protein